MPVAALVLECIGGQLEELLLGVVSSTNLVNFKAAAKHLSLRYNTGLKYLAFVPSILTSKPDINYSAEYTWIDRYTFTPAPLSVGVWIPPLLSSLTSRVLESIFVPFRFSEVDDLDHLRFTHSFQKTISKHRFPAFKFVRLGIPQGEHEASLIPLIVEKFKVWDQEGMFMCYSHWDWIQIGNVQQLCELHWRDLFAAERNGGFDSGGDAYMRFSIASW
ncbi:hypothetical protein BT69DRAFT_1317993 [Atractiella rhizophila]|nr:hypothetical protein BT69DRAFT_1317993 [Atractiella rhizophila]